MRCESTAVIDEAVSSGNPSHLETKFRFSRCLPGEANGARSLDLDFVLRATSLNTKHVRNDV